MFAVSKFEKIILFMLTIAVVSAIVLQLRDAPKPIKTLSDADVDNTIIGDSATNKGSDGPAYMSANWAWPQPLAQWNPTTTLRQ